MKHGGSDETSHTLRDASLPLCRRGMSRSRQPTKPPRSVDACPGAMASPSLTLMLSRRHLHVLRCAP